MSKKYLVGMGLALSLGLPACGSEDDFALELEPLGYQTEALQTASPGEEPEPGCKDLCAVVRGFPKVWRYGVAGADSKRSILGRGELEDMIIDACSRAVENAAKRATSHTTGCNAHIEAQKKRCKEKSFEDCTFEGACEDVQFGDKEITLVYKSPRGGEVGKITDCTIDQKTNNVRCHSMYGYRMPDNAEYLSVDCAIPMEGGAGQASCSKKPAASGG